MTEQEVSDPSSEPAPELPFGISRLLTIEEVSAWLRVPVGTVRRWVERRNIPYRKAGNLLRFSEAEIEAWMQPSVKTPKAQGGEADAIAASLRPVPSGPRRRKPSVKLNVRYD